jgi:hypothetical protein
METLVGLDQTMQNHLNEGRMCVSIVVVWDRTLLLLDSCCGTCMTAAHVKSAGMGRGCGATRVSEDVSSGIRQFESGDEHTYLEAQSGQFGERSAPLRKRTMPKILFGDVSSPSTPGKALADLRPVQQFIVQELSLEVRRLHVRGLTSPMGSMPYVPTTHFSAQAPPFQSHVDSST